MRAALATLPWAEPGTIEMDFKARELRFGFLDRDPFDAEAVKRALRGQGFAGVEWLSGP